MSAKMVSKAVALLSIAVGIYFVVFGVAKMTPKLSKDLHSSLKSHFIKYAKVSPLKPYLKEKNLKLKGKDYRTFAGGIELAGGLGMLCLPGRRSLMVANVMLLVISAFVIHTHMAIGDPLRRCTGVFVIGVLLIGRMLISFQNQYMTSKSKKSQKEEVKEKMS
ncbi:transmembrane protein 35A-like [Anneissia japonica]|uniref:transmembrane protein 35A-like n=1 Tax=Anneissia japonica TaxID=1529436 RepID=UPI0014256DD0|nr:transmembrane protein 35A-like [Anneissia japonica]